MYTFFLTINTKLIYYKFVIRELIIHSLSYYNRVLHNNKINNSSKNMASPILSSSEMRRRERELHAAAEEGRLKDVKHLLRLIGFDLEDRGIDINMERPVLVMACSSLSVASSRGYTDVVTILLQHGADVNE